MNKKFLTYGSIVLGVLFVLLGVYYFITPANALMHFMPGYAADVTKVHYKHGLGMIILAVACFAFAWFQSGKKMQSMQPKDNSQQNPNQPTV